LPGEITQERESFSQEACSLETTTSFSRRTLVFQKILASSQETFVFLSRYFRYFEIHSCLLKKFLFFLKEWVVR